ncbi:MAG: YbaN family protein [Rikenellaceae bacterium]
MILGSLFLMLGAVGVFVPILPTTPFWLLTCWFYLHSSEALYDRVMHNRHFGSYVRGFMVDKAIPLRSKVISITVMWSSILLTTLFFIDVLWLQILLLLVCTAVTFHILSFPTRKL